MRMGWLELLFLLVMLGPFVVLPIWGIMDAAFRSDSEWQAADQNKIVWILVQIFLNVVGALAYFLVIRPKLKDHGVR